jgi:phosphate transport system permease protein
MERVASTTITVGGLGVIIAVLGIMVFLGATVLPLFERGKAELALQSMAPVSKPLFGMMDEYTGLVMTVNAEGIARTVYLPSGEVVQEQRIVAGDAPPTAWNFSRQQGTFAFGLADGRVQLGTLGFDVSYVASEDRTEAMRSLLIGERTRSGTGYVERATADHFRIVTPVVQAREPAALKSGTGSVRLVDYRQAGGTELVLAIREQGAALNRVRSTKPLGGGPARTTLTPTSFELTLPTGNDQNSPLAAFVTGDAAAILLAWADGTVQRYAMGHGEDGSETVEVADLIRATRDGERVSCASLLLGSKTLLLGTDQGRALGVFVARADGTAAGPTDQYRLAVAHQLDVGTGAVASLGISQRDRSFLAGTSNGHASLRNMTSGKRIADLDVSDSPITFTDISPKLDAMLTIDAKGSHRLWSVDTKHSEASFSSLFGPVWYEGDARPSFTYQSSSGEDSAEPKLSLVPLLWGTLKATVYAMLFAVPLALLAAIYTSEMLHPNVRNRVKPIVEMMASLPSVVLGFIAALIIAPLARDWLPSILISFFVVPCTVLIAAYLWQMQPIRRTSRLRSGQHFGMVLLVTLIGLGASLALGRVVERMLFRPSESDMLVLAGAFTTVPSEQVPAWVKGRESLDANELRGLRSRELYFRDGALVKPRGDIRDPEIAAHIHSSNLDRADIRLWLDGVIGGPWPGWFLLLMAPAAIAAMFMKSRFVSPWLDQFEDLRFGRTAAITEFVKFIGTCVIATVLSALFGWMFSAVGLDPRDSIMGPFNQRNSLVVGIIMGFAIIPIIFTVSEDALSAVSPALRSASIGAGATRWQTAIRVVLPVAMSGIFSACMIGLGRAAGETMIVLMATGNTPTMDTSMFSGFRTLAANIAVELPEAPRESTHYRVLFLCGLSLFVLTFLVNTIAEIVRQRFRRRTAGL